VKQFDADQDFFNVKGSVSMIGSTSGDLGHHETASGEGGDSRHYLRIAIPNPIHPTAKLRVGRRWC
jgi:hypothetical protein